MIGITTDGIVCGRLGRRLPEAERWDQTGWQDLKGVPWDLRPTGRSMLKLRQAQPRQSEENEGGKRPREIRTSQAERRNTTRRSARETSQIRRAIFKKTLEGENSM